MHLYSESWLSLESLLTLIGQSHSNNGTSRTVHSSTKCTANNPSVANSTKRNHALFQRSIPVTSLSLSFSWGPLGFGLLAAGDFFDFFFFSTALVLMAEDLFASVTGCCLWNPNSNSQAEPTHRGKCAREKTETESEKKVSNHTSTVPSFSRPLSFYHHTLPTHASNHTFHIHSVV